MVTSVPGILAWLKASSAAVPHNRPGAIPGKNTARPLQDLNQGTAVENHVLGNSLHGQGMVFIIVLLPNIIF